jgi:hypothetical protein
MDSVATAVAIAGLITTGRPLADVLTDFVNTLFDSSLSAADKGVAGPVWARRRGESAAKVMLDAAKILDTANIVAQPVPGRLLIPILEKGSLEEDERVRTTWSRLLATAANPTTADTVLTSFPHILGELSPLEVHMLRFTYTKGAEKSGYHAFQLADISAYFQVNRADSLIYRDNLERLRLIAPPFGATAADCEAGEPYTGSLYLTSLGYAFIQACAD